MEFAELNDRKRSEPLTCSTAPASLIYETNWPNRGVLTTVRDSLFVIHALNAEKSEHGPKVKGNTLKMLQRPVSLCHSLHSSLIFNKAVKIFASIKKKNVKKKAI